MKFAGFSLILAFGLLAVKPLCCCATAAPSKVQTASSCCLTQPDAEARADDGGPCRGSDSDEPCGDCNSFSLIALNGRDVVEAFPPVSASLFFIQRPAAAWTLRVPESGLSRSPDWIHYRVNPSPPLLCVFRT